MYFTTPEWLKREKHEMKGLLILPLDDNSVLVAEIYHARRGNGIGDCSLALHLRNGSASSNAARARFSSRGGRCCPFAVFVGAGGQVVGVKAMVFRVLSGAFTRPRKSSGAELVSGEDGTVLDWYRLS